MTSTKPDLVPDLETADLPPVAVDAHQGLVAALGGKSPVQTASATDVATARTELAEWLRRVAASLGDFRRRPYEGTLLVLSSVTLAEAHHLDRKTVHSPCEAAHDLAVDLLRGHGQDTHPRVRRLLQAVVDGVATESGRRSFVAEVRSLLARARRWKPNCLDVDASMDLRLGGNVAGYRTSRDLPDGNRCLGTVTLGPTNCEGRLTLLIADGRAPESVHASVVSRVAAAAKKASNGVVQVLRDERGRPRFDPPLEFTPRAQRLAETVRSLHVRPRAKRLRNGEPTTRKKAQKCASSATHGP